MGNARAKDRTTEALIPCEFCSRKFDAASIPLHQSACRPDLLHFNRKTSRVSKEKIQAPKNDEKLAKKPFPSPKLQHSSEDTNYDSKLPSGVGIPRDLEMGPCEFCSKFFYVDDIPFHQSSCRPDLLHYAVQSPSVPPVLEPNTLATILKPITTTHGVNEPAKVEDTLQRQTVTPEDIKPLDLPEPFSDGDSNARMKDAEYLEIIPCESCLKYFTRDDIAIHQLSCGMNYLSKKSGVVQKIPASAGRKRFSWQDKIPEKSESKYLSLGSDVDTRDSSTSVLQSNNGETISSGNELVTVKISSQSKSITSGENINVEHSSEVMNTIPKTVSASETNLSSPLIGVTTNSEERTSTLPAHKLVSESNEKNNTKVENHQTAVVLEASDFKSFPKVEASSDSTGPWNVHDEQLSSKQERGAIDSTDSRTVNDCSGSKVDSRDEESSQRLVHKFLDHCKLFEPKAIEIQPLSGTDSCSDADLSDLSKKKDSTDVAVEKTTTDPLEMQREPQFPSTDPEMVHPDQIRKSVDTSKYQSSGGEKTSTNSDIALSNSEVRTCTFCSGIYSSSEVAEHERSCEQKSSKCDIPENCETPRDMESVPEGDSSEKEFQNPRTTISAISYNLTDFSAPAVKCASNTSAYIKRNPNSLTTIPCEFCSKLFYENFIAEHQSGCRPDILHYPMKESKSELSIGGSDSEENWSYSGEKVLPKTNVLVASNDESPKLCSKSGEPSEANISSTVLDTLRCSAVATLSEQHTAYPCVNEPKRISKQPLDSHFMDSDATEQQTGFHSSYHEMDTEIGGKGDTSREHKVESALPSSDSSESFSGQLSNISLRSEVTHRSVHSNIQLQETANIPPRQGYDDEFGCKQAKSSASPKVGYYGKKEVLLQRFFSGCQIVEPESRICSDSNSAKVEIDSHSCKANDVNRATEMIARAADFARSAMTVEAECSQNNQNKPTDSQLSVAAASESLKWLRYAENNLNSEERRILSPSESSHVFGQKPDCGTTQSSLEESSDKKLCPSKDHSSTSRIRVEAIPYNIKSESPGEDCSSSVLRVLPREFRFKSLSIGLLEEHQSACRPYVMQHTPNQGERDVTEYNANSEKDTTCNNASKSTEFTNISSTFSQGVESDCSDNQQGVAENFRSAAVEPANAHSSTPDSSSESCPVDLSNSNLRLNARVLIALSVLFLSLILSFMTF